MKNSEKVLRDIELKQLELMSRPETPGRVSTHELLCRVVIRMAQRIEELEEEIKRVEYGE